MAERLPQRTCVGCRDRAAKHDLLRVVAGEGVLVPDPRGRIPGRGAYLHPALVCLDLAERRRAFTRALRVGVGLDSGGLRTFLAEKISEREGEDRGAEEQGSVPADAQADAAKWGERDARRDGSMN